MKLKNILYRKGIRQVDLVRQLGLDPGRISLQINGIRPLPEKHQERLCKILGISRKRLHALCFEQAGDRT
jgi:transcriptional regulator with XRE-family HTH domain